MFFVLKNLSSYIFVFGKLMHNIYSSSFFIVMPAMLWLGYHNKLAQRGENLLNDLNYQPEKSIQPNELNEVLHYTAVPQIG